MTDKIKNPKGAGRKKKFTTEELSKIYDMFMLEDYKGIIDGAMLARYAVEHLNYPEGEIEGRHFLNDGVVGLKIKETQKERVRRYTSDALQMFESVNIQLFVKKYIKNPEKFEEVLLELQDAQKEMFKRTMHLDAENRELKSELKRFNDAESIYKKLQKNLENENKDLKEKVKMLKSLIDVDNHLKILKFVTEKTLIDGDLARQYLLILLRCGVISEKDAEEIKATKNKNETEVETASAQNVINLIKQTANKVEEEKKEDAVEDFNDISMEDIEKKLDDD